MSGALVGCEVIVITANIMELRHAFKAVHQLNAWRFANLTVPVSPEIIVIASPQLTGPTIADFRERFCRLLFDPTTQLLPELRAIRAERERLRDKGVLLLFFATSDLLHRVFLVGHDGRQDEMNLNEREIRLLLKLASAARAFTQDELAAAIGCRRNQVRVYIERVRAEYELRRRTVGGLIGRNDFIASPGHGYGWKLHGRIKHV